MIWALGTLVQLYQTVSLILPHLHSSSHFNYAFFWFLVLYMLARSFIGSHIGMTFAFGDFTLWPTVGVLLLADTMQWLVSLGVKG